MFTKTSVKEDQPPAAPDNISCNDTLLSLLITENETVGQVLATGIKQGPPSLNSVVLEQQRVEGLATARQLLLQQASSLEENAAYYESAIAIRAICAERKRRSGPSTPSRSTDIACLFPGKTDPSCSIAHIKNAHKLLPKKLKQVVKIHRIFYQIPLVPRVPRTKASAAVNRRFHKNCAACKLFEHRFTPHAHGYKIEPPMVYLCILAHAKFRTPPTVSDLKLYLTHYEIDYDLETTAQAQGPSSSEDINPQVPPATGAHHGDNAAPTPDDEISVEGIQLSSEEVPLPLDDMDF